jgi:hypothetical protein
MTTSVLAVPTAVLRTGRKLAKTLTLPAVAGAALVFRTMRRRDAAPAVRVTPDPGPEASPTVIPARSTGAAGQEEASAVDAPAPVVDPIPLAEPAVDLDVEVTLPSELPIRAFDALSAKDAVAAIRDLTEADEVRTVLAFEEENGKRTTVLAAARAHLTALERSVRP